VRTFVGRLISDSGSDFHEETFVTRSATTVVPLKPSTHPSASTIAPSTCGLPLHIELARQLDGLPNDLGVTLVVLGLFGAVIPGPIPPGASFIVMGTIILRPSLLSRSGAPLSRRFPTVFRVLVGMVRQFRLDLARRYPGSISPSKSEILEPETVLRRLTAGG